MKKTLRVVVSVVALVITGEAAFSQVNPTFEIKPPIVGGNPAAPAQPTAPKVSIWNWHYIPAVVPGFAFITPSIQQDLYQEITGTTPRTLATISKTQWAIAPQPAANAIFSSFQTKGDAILNVEGGDLILTNRTPGAAIRFGTTDTLVPDVEHMTIIHNGNVGIANTTPRDMLEIGDKFTFNSTGWKYIGFNFRWDPILFKSKRIDDTLESSRIAFTDHGDVQIDSWPVDANTGDTIYLDHANHLLTSQNFIRFWNDDEGEIASFHNATATEAGVNYFKHKVYIGTTDPGLTPSNDTFKLAVNGSVKAKEVIVDCADWTSWPDYVFKENYKLSPLRDLESSIGRLGHLPGMPSARDVESQGVNLGTMQAKLLEKVEELTLYMITMEKENRALRDRLSRLEGQSK